jgi:hypothetical protein
MTEKELELMLVKEVKRRGGRAYKFISPGSQSPGHGTRVLSILLLPAARKQSALEYVLAGTALI